MLPTSVEPLSQQYPNIQERFREILSNQFSKNTSKAYYSDIKKFQQWCRENKAGALNFETVLAYLTDISQSVKLATIRRRMVSLKHFCDKAGIGYDEKSLRQFIKGLRRTKIEEGESIKMASALQFDTLKNVIKKIDVANIKGKRDKALLLMAYTGAFRVSELMGLDIEDLRFDNKGCTVLVRKSKTDQAGRGMYKAIPFLFNEFCPVNSLQQYISSANIYKGPVFRTIKGRKSNVEITENRLDRHNAFRLLGSLAKGFSPHSLRSGFITDCKEAGISDSAIMQQSGHKSIAMVHHYARHKTVWQANAVNELFKKL
jgi:integrase